MRFAGGDVESSRASLVKALEANPRFVPALLNLAVDRFCQADLAGTERLIRRSTEIDPQETFAMMWLALQMNFTGRYDEAISVAKRLRQSSSDVFYITVAHQVRAIACLDSGDIAGAEQTIGEALGDGADATNIRSFEALIAAHKGQTEAAKAILREYEGKRGLGASALVALGCAACRVGEQELAIPFLARRMASDLAPSMVRLIPDLHPLADHEMYAPRRRDVALIWPLEAPMIDPASFALFREVQIQSGIPKGSDLQVG
jgi:tetratricopeptide (TPR) repeat protein